MRHPAEEGPSPRARLLYVLLLRPANPLKMRIFPPVAAEAQLRTVAPPAAQRIQKQEHVEMASTKKLPGEKSCPIISPRHKLSLLRDHPSTQTV